VHGTLVQTRSHSHATGRLTVSSLAHNSQCHLPRQKSSRPSPKMPKRLIQGEGFVFSAPTSDPSQEASSAALTPVIHWHLAHRSQSRSLRSCHELPDATGSHNSAVEREAPPLLPSDLIRRPPQQLLIERKRKVGIRQSRGCPMRRSGGARGGS
jgi:hypothetical protein